MTDEERGAIERAKDVLRTQILHLRRESRNLDAQVEELTSRAEEVVDELAGAEAALKDLARIDAPRLHPEGAKVRKRRAAVSLEEAREVMARLGRFSIPSLAEEMGVHVSTARRLVTAALEHNGGGDKAMIRDTGEQAPPRGGKGRHSTIYEMFKPPTQGSAPHTRPRSAPEVELRRRGARPAPTGRKLRVKKETRELIAMAEQAGYEPVRRKGEQHVRLVKPGARALTLGDSPSDHRSTKNAKSSIKRQTRAA